MDAAVVNTQEALTIDFQQRVFLIPVPGTKSRATRSQSEVWSGNDMGTKEEDAVPVTLKWKVQLRKQVQCESKRPRVEATTIPKSTKAPRRRCCNHQSITEPHYYHPFSQQFWCCWYRRRKEINYCVSAFNQHPRTETVKLSPTHNETFEAATTKFKGSSTLRITCSQSKAL